MFAPVAAIAALAAAVAFAGPAPKQAKTKAAAKAACPHAAAQCADCPSAKKHADCPMAAGKCPMSGKTATAKAATSKSGGTVMKCAEGTKVIDVAKLTKAGRYTDYKGKRYYFACPKCPTLFKQDPVAFTKSHTGFPIPKASKAKASS
jgi:YHS domain-containing protein